MKRAALAAILCILFTAVTHAQQTPADAPASKEDFVRFMDVMHSRDMMMNMMNLMAKQTSQMVHQQVSKQTDLPPDAEERINKMTQDMFKNFPVDDLIQAMIPVYQKHFTNGDIDAFVAFYSTPAGQKLLRDAGDHSGKHAGFDGRSAKNGRQYAAADSGRHQPAPPAKQASPTVNRARRGAGPAGETGTRA